MTFVSHYSVDTEGNLHPLIQVGNNIYKELYSKKYISHSKFGGYTALEGLISVDVIHSSDFKDKIAFIKKYKQILFLEDFKHSIGFINYTIYIEDNGDLKLRVEDNIILAESNHLINIKLLEDNYIVSNLILLLYKKICSVLMSNAKNY